MVRCQWGFWIVAKCVSFCGVAKFGHGSMPMVLWVCECSMLMVLWMGVIASCWLLALGGGSTLVGDGSMPMGLPDVVGGRSQ